MKKVLLSLALFLAAATAVAQTPLATFDFSTEPATGALHAGDMLDGQAITSHEAHTQSFYGSFWHRLPDTTTATRETYSGMYPVFCQPNYFVRMTSPSCMNGYMLMSMEETMGSRGGNSTQGNFNAWFSLGRVNTTGYPAIYVNLYQRFSRYYYDHCFIDYSTDSLNWHSVEFNVLNVDVSMNSNRNGFVRINMPTDCGNQENLYLRLRWASNESAYECYGMYWLVDDVSIMPIPQVELTGVRNEYFEGFYHIMPQGLQVPMVWNSIYRNGGLTTQTGIYGSILHSDTYRGASTELTRHQAPDLTFPNDGQLVVDPLGWYDNSFANTDDAGFPHGWGYSGAQGVGPYACLPTDRTGVHFVQTDITTDQTAHISNGEAYPKVGYHVNGFDEENPMAVQFDSVWCAVWGRDNGVLVRDAYFAVGFLPDETYTTTAQEGFNWAAAGYQQLLTYVTGSSVPEDWRIKGVQIVASTTPSNQSLSTGIFTRAGSGSVCGVLYKDSLASDKTLYPNFVETGAVGRVITENEIQNRNSLTYRTLESGYTVINFEFPNQPRLEPNSSYSIGYELEEDSYFAPASGYNIGYRTLPDAEGNSTFHYFSSMANGENEDEMMSYARTFGLPNYTVYTVNDPSGNAYEGYYWNNVTVSSIPMIRMIVGPYEEKPQTRVFFDCGAHGEMMDYNQSTAYCGTTTEFTAGSVINFTLVPDGGYLVDRILVDGNVVFVNDSNDMAHFEDGVFVQPIDIAGDEMTISVIFRAKPGVGIGPMDELGSLRLSPNPASGALTVETGVSSAQTLEIMDLTGRVVIREALDAQRATIDLSALTSGVYFVRVGTQVRKLIVK